MPEGDTIHRTAAALRARFVGLDVVAAESLRPPFVAERLVGRRLTGAEARGKNLLMRFDDRLELVSHMGMEGAWHGYATGARWKRPRSQAAIALDFGAVTAVCFSPARLQLIRTSDLALHGALAGLGPDLLAADVDVDAALENLAARSNVPVGEALLDQRVMAGIGNVYKSETLFLERVDPFVKVAALDEASLRGLVARARSLMLQNLDGARRRTRRALGGPRLWVYGRSGRPCLVCGATVAMRRQGDAGRSTYHCPVCQVGGRT